MTAAALPHPSENAPFSAVTVGDLIARLRSFPASTPVFISGSGLDGVDARLETVVFAGLTADTPPVDVVFLDEADGPLIDDRPGPSEMDTWQSLRELQHACDLVLSAVWATLDPGTQARVNSTAIQLDRLQAWLARTHPEIVDEFAAYVAEVLA